MYLWSSLLNYLKTNEFERTADVNASVATIQASSNG
jgi:hypothetical protein